MTQIAILDPGRTLSEAQVETLTAKAAAYPFDVHVLIGSGGSSRAGFEREVASYVKPGSRTVSIGVDPLHHFSFVQSSAALGVPPGPQVAQAGNPFFKAGNLVDGIDAIAAKANQLRVEPVAVRAFVAGPDQRVIQSQTGVPIVIQENHTSAGVWWGVGAFVLLACAVVAYAYSRARKARLAARAAEEALTVEAAEFAARNVEERGWHDSMAARRRSTPPSVPPAPAPTYSRPVPAPLPFVSQAPAPVIVQQGGGGMDLLLGYELGRSSSRPAIVERETVVVERESSSSSSYFGGSDSSSSSDWSSSSDSSSSFDFGGGSDSSSGSDW